MSWRGSRFSSYNREEDKEEFHYWMELFNQETWYDPVEPFWCDGDWWHYYGAPGYISNMDEFHKMKVTTLLRKLNIKSAKELAKEKGWE